jgi:hypothetical protein
MPVAGKADNRVTWDHFLLARTRSALAVSPERVANTFLGIPPGSELESASIRE